MKKNKLSHDLVGKRIAAERERLSYSRDELAEICGVTNQNIASIEKGNSGPSAWVLSCLAREGADTKYILTGQRVLRLGGMGELWPSEDYDPEDSLDLDKLPISHEEKLFLQEFRKLAHEDQLKAIAIVAAIAGFSSHTQSIKVADNGNRVFGRGHIKSGKKKG